MPRYARHLTALVLVGTGFAVLDRSVVSKLGQEMFPMLGTYLPL